MKVLPENGPYKVVELEHGDRIQLFVPASLGRTCLYLEVGADGMLCISGGASVIAGISVDGLPGRVRGYGG